MEESINSKGFKSFHVLITFAIIWDPYQAPKNVWPDLDPNYLTLLGVPERLKKKKKVNTKILICRRQNKNAELIKYMQKLSPFDISLQCFHSPQVC